MVGWFVFYVVCFVCFGFLWGNIYFVFVGGLLFFFGVFLRGWAFVFLFVCLLFVWFLHVCFCFCFLADGVYLGF